MEDPETEAAKLVINSTLEAVEIIDKWYNMTELSASGKEKTHDDTQKLELAKEFIAGCFKITPRQAVFLTAVFILTNDGTDHFGGDNDANFGQIAKALKFSRAEMFRHIGDFDALIERGILSTDDEINKIRQNFMITSNAVDTILSGTSYEKPENKESLSELNDFLRKHNNQINKVARENGNPLRIIKYFEEKYDKLSSQFPLVKYINDLNIPTIEKILFFETCGSTLFHDGKIKVSELADSICSNVREKRQFLRKLLAGDNLLMREDLLDIESGTFLNEIEVSLTEKALKLYLGEEAELYSGKVQNKNVTAFEDIVPRILYFTGESQRQLSELESVLKPENFSSLRKRLLEKGLPMGLTVMLYGGPGTGKTESVMQIARKTGRNVLHVDISSVKSMWLGESEKLIKKVFVRYNTLVSKEKNCPVLLFNEADAIFNKRKTGDIRGAETTMNAMQNIILEEMEHMKGIMIATTNLIGNLDAAFERRFLFKVRLDNPSPDVKQKIWADRFPCFSEEEFGEIARKYDFSGGEIDNIVRKLTMNEIIEGSAPTLQLIDRLCRQEKFRHGSCRPIGFL